MELLIKGDPNEIVDVINAVYEKLSGKPLESVKAQCENWRYDFTPILQPVIVPDSRDQWRKGEDGTWSN